MKRILLPLLLMLLAQPLAAQKKVAILVGNGEYSDSRFHRLPTSAADLDQMERTLRSLGYSTYALRDATKDELLAKMVELENQLREADVAVFYYSGHGVSYGGDAYIVPCRTKLHTSILEQQCVSTGWIAAQLEAKCRLSFLFLDCCREREEALAYGGYSKGPLEVPPDPALNRDGRPSGQMILYATRNGKLASTGTGETSTFTRVLASHLGDDEEFTTVAYNVREEVSRLTSGQQVPDPTGTYIGHFRFSGKPAAAQPAADTASFNNASISLAAWEKEHFGGQIPPCPSSDSAFMAYWQKAHEGDAESQNQIGYSYSQGEGVTADKAEAVRWYRRAAEQGHATAQSNLGYMYYYGYGVEQSYALAEKYFRYSADQGLASAQLYLGIMYRNGQFVVQDYAEAVRWYRLAAEQGDGRAQNNLGYMYEHALGVNQNYTEAAKWYRRGAKEGNASAQNNLGTLYDHGRGVKQSDSEAFKWYLEAAKNGNQTAQCNLGLMYYNGQGVKQDYAEAFKWFYKAAEADDDDAQYRVAIMYENGLGVAQDYAEAIKWCRMAAEQGNLRAQLELGGFPKRRIALD